MITSFFPGRLRLRAPIFREADLVGKALPIVRKNAAVKNVENNLLTGSVLIEYDPDKVPLQKLLSMQDFFTSLAEEAKNYDGTNRQKILSMLDELEKIF